MTLALPRGLYELVERDVLMIAWLNTSAGTRVDFAGGACEPAALLSKLQEEMNGERHAYQRHFGPGLVLSPLVEHGKLTQAEADTVEVWWDSRPDAVDPFLVIHSPHPPQRHRRPH